MIIIYGDSHAMLGFQNLSRTHHNAFAYSKTMFSLGRDRHITNFVESHVKPEYLYCFVFGEVDVRCHIGKYDPSTREQECLTLIKNYLDTIQSKFPHCKKILITAVSPPVRQEDHEKSHHHVLPFIGSNQDRVEYTKIMNRVLEEQCAVYEYTFFNPYTHYKESDGCLNYLLSDGCIHIGKNQMFLDCFEEVIKTFSQQNCAS